MPFSTPESEIYSFHLQTRDNVSIGVWHINPLILFDNLQNPLQRKDKEVEIASTTHVYLYLHGNAGTRAQHTRIAFYQSLRGVDRHAHVLAIDYRGYGDSDRNLPTEGKLMLDVMTAWEYLVKNKKVSAKNIVIVGHSLGTGIAIKFISILKLVYKQEPGGLIVIAPFKSLPEVALEYPYMPILTLFKYHSALAEFAKSLMIERFNSTEHIEHVTCPVLMLHGASDMVIPVQHAYSLFTTLLGYRIHQHLGKHIDKSNIVESVKPYYRHKGIGNEAFILKADNKAIGKGVWLVEVLWAGHNNLHWYAVARDATRAWLTEIGW